jgi:hypothetical protein
MKGSNIANFVKMSTVAAAMLIASRHQTLRPMHAEAAGNCSKCVDKNTCEGGFGSGSQGCYILSTCQPLGGDCHS